MKTIRVLMSAIVLAVLLAGCTATVGPGAWGGHCWRSWNGYTHCN